MRRFAHNAKSQFVGPSPYDRLPNDDSDPVKIYPSQTANQIKWGLIIAALVIAVPALIMSAVSLSYGKNDVSDPLNLDGATITNLTVDTIKVNTLFDADMANVIPGTWMMPPAPSKKRSTANYDVVPADRQILLGRSGVTYDLRFPKQLSAYVSREFHVYSNTSQAHTILLTNALNSGSCETSYSDVTWDSERKFPLVRFKDVPGAYIHFKVVDCGTLTLIESRFVDFCTANMSHCEHPKRDVNADWADVRNLNADMVTMTPLVVTANGELPMTHNVVHLSNTLPINMTVPADLTFMIGKTFKVCSVDGNPHVINAYPHYFGSQSFWQVLRFETGSLCCFEFTVSSNNAVRLVSRDACSVFCTNMAQKHCIDPKRPDETSLLHGRYRHVTKNSFQVPYLEIDMTQVPIQVKRFAGTVNHVRERTNFDFFSSLSSAFGYDTSTILSRDTDNVIDDSSDPFALTLQSDQKTLVEYVARETVGFNDLDSIHVYEKLPKFENVLIAPFSTGKEPGDSRHPEDPVKLFENNVDSMLYAGNSHVAKSVNSSIFIGIENSLELKDRIMRTGITYTTSIFKIFKTGNVDIPITRIRTSDPHNIALPSRVTIFGCTGSWSVINGEHIISAGQTTVHARVDGDYQDFSNDPDNRTIHYDFTIHFDSTSLPADANNVATSTGPCQVSVSYGPINSATEYLDTLSALSQWFYESFGVSMHSFLNVELSRTQFIDISSSLRLSLAQSTWDEVIADNAQNAQIRTDMFLRERFPSGIYTNILRRGNPNFQSRILSLIDLNNRFGYNPFVNASLGVNAPHYYHIPLQNYVTNAKVPYFRCTGSTRFHPDNLFAMFGFGVSGCDTFESIMVNYGELPPVGYNFLASASPLNAPSPFGTNYSSLSPETLDLYRSNFFAGQINPNFTGTKTIGYIRMADFSMSVRFGLDVQKEFFPPGATVSPRENREASVKILSSVFHYLVTELESDHIIIDIRENFGGFQSVYSSIRDFFGTEDQQTVVLTKKSPAHEAFAPLVDVSQFSYVSDVISAFQHLGYTYPTVTEANYPGSVFTNGEVILLTDANSVSGGDVFPNIFLGTNFDRNLGNSTVVKIVGDIDGRLIGSACFNGYIQTSRNNPKIVQANGNPSLPITFRRQECGGFARFRVDGSSLSVRHPALQPDCTPLLRGLSGGCPLPNDEDTLLFPDLGYLPNTRPRLIGDARPLTPNTANRSDWRDAWLEESVRLALDSPLKKRKQPIRKFAKKSVAHTPVKTARNIYKRDVHCPENVVLRHMHDVQGTIDIHVKQDELLSESREYEIEARRKASAIMEKEMHSGGLCVEESTGEVMVTPSCQGLPKLIFD